MELEYFTDDLKEMKEKYKNIMGNLSYATVNELNHFYFRRVILEIRTEPKFKELQKKNRK